MRHLISAMPVVVPVIHLLPLQGRHGLQVGRVVTADVVALVCLVIGTVALMYERRGG